MSSLLWLLIIVPFITTNGLNTCPNTNPSKYPPTKCPDTSSCCGTPFVANGYGCTQPSIDDPNFNFCCFAGPSNLDETNIKPNVMILGDSVSIGYTPYVITNLSSIAYVQHSPWSSDGGSGSITYGLSCLPIFLYSMNQSFINWDIIQFNFGLHDLDN